MNIIIIQEITKLERSDGPLPPERAYHAACCLGYGSECPCILVTGGWAKDDETLKDAWIYDFMSNHWVKVMHYSKLVLLTSSDFNNNSNFAVGPTK